MFPKRRKFHISGEIVFLSIEALFLTIGLIVICRQLVYEESLPIRETMVYATVCEKEFIAEKRRMVGKVWRYFPEEYLVSVRYKDIIKIIDIEELYNLVEEGDDIEVIFCEKIDEEGNVKDEYIKINR